MPHCVNCGASYEKRYPFCEGCLTDPAIPEAEMERALSEMEQESYSYESAPHFIFPGERAHLLFAALISTGVSVLLGVLTISVYFWLLLGTVLFIRYRQWQMQKHLPRISQGSAPDLWRLVRLASFRLGVPPPPTHILNSEEPNAFTSGFWGDSYIVLQTGLLKLLDNKETLAVIGHEMGHVRYGHSTWMALSNPPTASMRFSPITALLGLLFNSWSLKAEYTADRGGLLATRDLDSTVRCQLKLSLGKDLGEKVNVESFLEDGMQGSQDGFSRLIEHLGSHPFPQNRIKGIFEFSRTEDYRKELSS